MTPPSPLRIVPGVFSSRKRGEKETSCVSTRTVDSGFRVKGEETRLLDTRGRIFIYILKWEKLDK